MHSKQCSSSQAPLRQQHSAQHTLSYELDLEPNFAYRSDPEHNPVTANFASLAAGGLPASYRGCCR